MPIVHVHEAPSGQFGLRALPSGPDPKPLWLAIEGVLVTVGGSCRIRRANVHAPRRLDDARAAHCGNPESSSPRHEATRGSGSPQSHMRTPAINPAVSHSLYRVPTLTRRQKLDQRGGSGGGSGAKWAHGDRTDRQTGRTGLDLEIHTRVPPSNSPTSSSGIHVLRATAHIFGPGVKRLKSRSAHPNQSVGPA